MVFIFTEAGILFQTVFGADMEDKEREKDVEVVSGVSSQQFQQLTNLFGTRSNFLACLPKEVTPKLYFIQALPIPSTLWKDQ